MRFRFLLPGSLVHNTVRDSHGEDLKDWENDNEEPTIIDYSANRANEEATIIDCIENGDDTDMSEDNGLIYGFCNNCKVSTYSYLHP